MANIIQIKRSITTTVVPADGTLAEGELAINILDRNVWVGNTAGNPVLLIDGGNIILNAVNVIYDNVSSGLTATNVQAALDEIMSIVSGHIADTANPHDTRWGNLLDIPDYFPPEPHDHDCGYF